MSDKSETIQDAAHGAKRLINDSRVRVRDASYIALQSQDYELTKSLDAVERMLGEIVELLICMPRLKG